MYVFSLISQLSFINKIFTNLFNYIILIIPNSLKLTVPKNGNFILMYKGFFYG